MAGTTFNAFTKKTLGRADALIRAVGIATFSAIIRDTPVGNPSFWRSGRAPKGYVGGRLRTNWRCSLAAPDTSTTTATDYANTIPNAESVCQSADRNKVLWLSNGLPYAGVIEYDGHSKQAPAGMVRRNVARIQDLISRELTKLKG